MQACIGMNCGVCVCPSPAPPTPQSCTGPGGCQGTRSCSGSQCDACVCTVTPSFAVDGIGNAAGLTASPDGTGFVRLEASPWLVRYTPDGTGTLIPPRASLDWVEDFVAVADHSVWLAGTINPYKSAGRHVQIQHLDESGNLLSSSQWGIAPDGSTVSVDSSNTFFQGMARGSDGSVFVATGAFATTGFAFSLHIMKVLADGSPSLERTVSDALDSQGNRLEISYIHEIAAGSGTFALAGGGDGPVDMDPFVATLGASTTATGTSMSASFALLGGLASDRSGGWVLSYGAGFTNGFSGIGVYDRHLRRLDARGQVLWSKDDELRPAGGAFDDVGFRRTSIAVLDDSILWAREYPSDGAHEIDRYDFDGNSLMSFSLPMVGYATAAGPDAALLVELQQGAYTLVRLDLPPLSISKHPAGASCATGVDCSSGTCCSTSSSAGVCSDGATCDQGSSCTDETTCTGTCVKPTGQNSGFCANHCAASSDCPQNTYCVSGICLQSCSASTDCPYPGTQCATKDNTEALSVSVCAYP